MDQIVTADEENGGDIYELHDVLSNGTEDVSVAVARKLDWQSLCPRLAPRENSIIELMSQGKQFTAVRMTERNWNDGHRPRVHRSRWRFAAGSF